MNNIDSLSIRDYIAIEAMKSLIISYGASIKMVVAREAYIMADLMIEESSKNG